MSIEKEELKEVNKEAQTDDEEKAYPEITEDTYRTSILINGTSSIEAIHKANKSSGISEGISCYLSEKGVPRIGDGFVTFRKDAILFSDNPKTIKRIGNFDISVTEDDLQIAFDRMKKLISVGCPYRGNYADIDIIGSYVKLMKFILPRAKDQNTENMENFVFRYKPNEGTVGIETGSMRKILNAIELSYDPVEFARGLENYGIATGKELIERANSKRFPKAFANNKRYYVFKIDRELLKENGIEDF